MNKRQLWLRLKNYHFDHLAPTTLWESLQAKFGGPDASTKAFAQKLARKLGWSQSFALRAIHEYRKFVYLGVVSDFVVTPSEPIDQVWHQHILFSRAYRNFCQEVIQYDFDHNPELLPADDQTGIFHAQYLDTLELYREEFGIDPPADIWGTPKFDAMARYNGYRSRKKANTALLLDGNIDGNSSHDGPLYQSFDAHTDGSFAEFVGFEGGDGGGAGSSGSWSDGDGGSDGSGGDSGSCSSCSSGCGGGD